MGLIMLYIVFSSILISVINDLRHTAKFDLLERNALQTLIRCHKIITVFPNNIWWICSNLFQKFLKNNLLFVKCQKQNYWFKNIRRTFLRSSSFTFPSSITGPQWYVNTVQKYKIAIILHHEICALWILNVCGPRNISIIFKKSKVAILLED